MNIFFISLLIFILVDGIKMIVEFFRVKELEKKDVDYSKVSVVMSAYNEEKMILKTIDSFIENGFLEKNIFICDDGSTDETANIIEKNYPEIKLYKEKNKGKALSIDFLIQKVRTKYVFIVDADVVLEKNFYIPLWKLEEDKATAIAFNIVPYNKPRKFLEKIVVGLQSLEYAKSMLIGKQSQNKTMSVSCISGAAGVFITKRMKELSSKHSGNFSGEDLQRTLIELLNDGNIVFSNSTVYTDVPKDFVNLSKQRVVGWWAGLYHCFPLYIKVFFFRKSPMILRYEVLYDVFALLTDPFKIWFFLMIIIHQQWIFLAFLYLVYFLMDFILVFLIRNQFETRISKILLTVLYPIYSFVQMFYRVFAFFRFVYHRFFTRKIKPLKKNIKITLTAILLFLSTVLHSQSRTAIGNIGLDKQKKNFTFAYENSVVMFSDNQSTSSNITTYLGYKKLWYEGSYIVDPRQTIGYYIPKGLVWARWRTTDWQAFVNRNILNSNGFITSYNLTYQHIYRTDVTTNRNISILGVELEKYISDKENFIFSLRKEWGRENDVIGILTYNHKTDGPLSYRIGMGSNNRGDAIFFSVIKYDHIYLITSYNENFDYNNYNRGTVGIGVKF